MRGVLPIDGLRGIARVHRARADQELLGRRGKLHLSEKWRGGSQQGKTASVASRQ
jgi:hypothetical protein